MARAISATELGIELKPDDDSSLFKWFIASFLMGKRIQAPIAAQAYKVIVEEQGRDTARKLQHCTSRGCCSRAGHPRRRGGSDDRPRPDPPHAGPRR